MAVGPGCGKELPYIFGVSGCSALLASVMVQWVLAVFCFAGITVDVIWLVSVSLGCVVSPCVSWVTRVNGGVASGLGGASSSLEVVVLTLFLVWHTSRGASKVSWVCVDWSFDGDDVIRKPEVDSIHQQYFVVACNRAHD